MYQLPLLIDAIMKPIIAPYIIEIHGFDVIGQVPEAQPMNL